jgi:hypothetical protein
MKILSSPVDLTADLKRLCAKRADGNGRRESPAVRRAQVSKQPGCPPVTLNFIDGPSRTTQPGSGGNSRSADTLEKYNPPAQVKDAIEHFVTTGGAHFDDPDYTTNNKLVADWVKQVCPT